MIPLHNQFMPRGHNVKDKKKNDKSTTREKHIFTINHKQKAEKNICPQDVTCNYVAMFLLAR